MSPGGEEVYLGGEEEEGEGEEGEEGRQCASGR